MSWKLEIHTIDVGQGESSLIVAENENLMEPRTMLIDGGEQAYAETIHKYIAEEKELKKLDKILVTHYDEDHTKGIVALLAADNLYWVCDAIARAAAIEAVNDSGAPLDADRNKRIICVAAAAVCAMRGAYNIPDDEKKDKYIRLIVGAIRVSPVPERETGEDTSEYEKRIAGKICEMARENADNVKEITDSTKPPSNVFPLNTPFVSTLQTLKKVGIAAGIAAANALESQKSENKEGIVEAIRDSVFHNLKSSLKGPKINTGGIYANTEMIDIGDHESAKNTGYKAAVSGKIELMGKTGSLVQAPGIVRHRTQPKRGQEILWNSGSEAAVQNDPRAPLLFVLAVLNTVWKSDTKIKGDNKNNSNGLGLILRFNRFLYYTAGDIPKDGEMLIASKIFKKTKDQGIEGLAFPAADGGETAVPHRRIACFKCGHHGADESTSKEFLELTNPAAAFISCGANSFGKAGKKDLDPLRNHPVTEVLERLQAHKYLKYYYLTNCHYSRDLVPRTQNKPQLNSNLDTKLPIKRNKSRVCGDNNPDNNAAGRNRGNIMLSISEAASISKNTDFESPFTEKLRQFSIHYWEPEFSFEKDSATNIRTESIIF